MSWEIDEPTPTPEEIAEARALAESLESGSRDALGAARVVGVLSEEPLDEMARVRLRRSLVAAASPKRPPRRLVALAASIALAAGLGTLLLRRPAPSDDVLATRERLAREAVTRLLSTRATVATDGVDRVASALVAEHHETLRSTLRRERTETLLGERADGPLGSFTSPIASPTPGGRS